jgi:3-phosphoshikimate 1-carboxyvinyltransferase
LSRLNVKYKGPLKGELIPPSDKSISHRAIMLASLASGKSTISNLLRAEDPLRTLNAFRMMGIESEEDPPSGTLTINGKGLKGLTEPKGVIDCGNSGTTMRLMSGVLAGQPFTSILTGDQYLLRY